MSRARAFLVAAVLAAGAIGPAASADAKSVTYLGCGYRSALEISAHPRDCFLDWPNLDLAHAVHLRRVAWATWGSPVARGRAVFRVKTYDPWTHVSVRAFARRSCGAYGAYTRVRVDFGRTAHTWHTPGCADIHIDD